MTKKSKLEILKGNVDAQELRLQEALNSLEAAKARAQEKESPSTEGGMNQGMSSSWDMLERIVGLEGDLLSSYREYVKELEKRTKKEKQVAEQELT